MSPLRGAPGYGDTAEISRRGLVLQAARWEVVSPFRGLGGGHYNTCNRGLGYGSYPLRGIWVRGI